MNPFDTLISNPFSTSNTPALSGQSPFAASPLGVGINTVLGLPKAAMDTGVDIFHNITSSIASLLPSVTSDFGGPEAFNAPSSPGILKTAFTTLFGDKPITSLQTQVAQGEQAIKASPFAKSLGLDKFALPLAFGGVVGSEALNFTPLGGEAKVVDTLATEADPAIIVHTLEQIGVHSDLAPTFAEHIAQANTPHEVQDIVDVMKSTQGLKQVDENIAAKGLPEGSLPVEAQPLAEGATQTTPELASKLPLGEDSPALNPIENTPPQSSVPLSSKVADNFQYVKNEPLNIDALGNDKTTATNIREEYAGVKNSQIARGNQLADELRGMAPKEQDGMFWYKAAKGDTATLEGLLKDPKFEQYKPGIESALNLSPEAKAALAKGDQYYSEAGAVSKDTGTINSIREDYMNRLYKPEPSTDFVKTEMGQGLKQTTSHAKARVFDSEIDAVKGGKEFATTNYADALAIHNSEMARVNTARTLMDTMEKRGLGAWVNPATDRPSAGWTQVGQLRNGAQSFYAPSGIAKGLSAIADPDFMRKVDTIAAIQKYQGLVKSVDLAFSFFHHLTFVTQTLSSKGGLVTMGQMLTGGLKMDAPEFLAMEQDFIRHDGMTSQIESTQDIMKELSKGDDNISKLLQLPVGKQINSAIEASNKFLFNKMQRFLKVMTYQKNAASWVASHPTATNPEVIAAKRGFAKAVNAEFGGLNWQAMGVTKSNQSILRTIFLAPDWLTSAGAQVKYAVSDPGTAGNTSRMTLVKAVVGGMAITEGVNKLITGHFTDQNPKGHGMEIEVAPNVYVSLIRGAPGELVKFVSNTIESGPIQGPARYLQGKLSPIARTGLEFASGVDYNGKSIYQGGKHPTILSKTFGGLIALLTNISPVPFSFSSIGAEMGSKQATPLGIAAAATGIGRVSIPKSKGTSKANPFNQ